MIISTELSRIVLAALTLIVGSIIIFGHRCSDQSSKYNEKPKIDELKEIRIAVRSETTVPALNDIWRFLKNAEKKYKEEGVDFNVTSLFYDIKRREEFNKLINNLEQTFVKSEEIKYLWEKIQKQYSRIGNVLYFFAAYIGLSGFSLLNIYTMTEPIIAESLLNQLSLFFILSSFMFLIVIIYLRENIIIDRNNYDKVKKKHLIDELRL